MVVRQHHNLGLDEDDVRLIRCSNCLQIFACLCQIVAMCTECEGDDQAACIIDAVADIVFCSVAGCSTAQAHHEMNLRETNAAPQAQRMDRW